MKQLKVKNPKLQKLLDRLSGWPEWVIVALAWALALLVVYIAAHYHPSVL